jgi:hypothetical protein
MLDWCFREDSLLRCLVASAVWALYGRYTQGGDNRACLVAINKNSKYEH